MLSQASIPVRGRIVLLGADGMLGTSWRRSLESTPGHTVSCPGIETCDLTRPETITSAIDGDVGLVINAAAYTDVDGAESDEAMATRINGDGVGALAARCREVGATLVHYSTDYVFDGQATEPYRVDEPRRPLNAYGRSKAAGEEHIEQSGAAYLLIRTSWLYAAHGKNFVRTIARACLERPSLRVVNDQRGRPTSADQLVSITRRLLAARQRGVFHACDDGACTWFELANAIADRINPDCVVEPCSSAEFPRPARRPAYSVLDLSKTVEAIGPLLPWREALGAALDVIARERTAA